MGEKYPTRSTRHAELTVNLMTAAVDVDVDVVDDVDADDDDDQSPITSHHGLANSGETREVVVVTQPEQERQSERVTDTTLPFGGGGGERESLGFLWSVVVIIEGGDSASVSESESTMFRTNFEVDVEAEGGGGGGGELRGFVGSTKAGLMQAAPGLMKSDTSSSITVVMVDRTIV